MTILVQVHKILGPGNQYVTAAKMALQNSEAMISMDMPAGPSEVLIIADSAASPAHVAADLLSQAEHGPDSQVGATSMATTVYSWFCKELVLSGWYLKRYCHLCVQPALLDGHWCILDCILLPC